MSFDILNKTFKNDKDKIQKYIEKLYSIENINIKNPIIINPLTTLFNLYPLPNELQFDYFSENENIIKKNNQYFYMGIPGDRILFANRRLPYYGNDPIPFSFPITESNLNRTNIIQSNIFYFEVKMCDDKFRESWKNECLSIGFGTPSTPIKSQVGWCNNSWGFHSDDGSFIHNNNSLIVSKPWEINIIYGVGLKYLSKNKYNIFLTINGKLIDLDIQIETAEYLIPMIGLDLSVPIEINWGENPFIFDIKKQINCNNILSHKNNFLKDLDSKKYKIKPTNKFVKKLFKTIKISELFSELNNNSSSISNMPGLEYINKNNSSYLENKNIKIYKIFSSSVFDMKNSIQYENNEDENQKNFEDEDEYKLSDENQKKFEDKWKKVIEDENQNQIEDEYKNKLSDENEYEEQNHIILPEQNSNLNINAPEYVPSQFLHNQNLSNLLQYQIPLSPIQYYIPPNVLPSINYPPYYIPPPPNNVLVSPEYQIPQNIITYQQYQTSLLFPGNQYFIPPLFSYPPSIFNNTDLSNNISLQKSNQK